MKKIEFNSPLRTFSKSPLKSLSETRSLPFYVVRRNLFNRQTAFFLLILISLLFVFVGRYGTVLFLSLSCCAAFLYVFLWQAAQNLNIKLYVVDRAREFDRLKVKLQLIPMPSRGWAQMSLGVHFAGSRKSFEGRSIRGHEHKRS